MLKPLPSLPSDLLKLMADVGPRWRDDVPGNVQLMTERFSEVLRQVPKAGVTVKSDQPYGDHPRQRLDVFQPNGESILRPAVIFVHGGAFVSGHRNKTSEIYANVLYCMARNGIVGINVGYRLADDAPYPEASYDIEASLAWVHSNAAALGVDPDRIFLFGHSAGAAHVAGYAYNSSLRTRALPSLAGVIIVSGRVRADNSPENPNAGKVAAYYGADSTKYDERSPVSHVSAESPPTFVAWGEFENPLIDVYCAELVYRLAASKGKTPPSLWLRGHNHTSTIGQLNTAEDALEKAIVAFISAPK